MSRSVPLFKVLGISVGGMLVCLVGIRYLDIQNLSNPVIISSSEQIREPLLSRTENNIVVKSHENTGGVDWEELFRFLPKVVGKCQRIFENLKNASASIYTDSYIEAIKNLKSFMIRKKLKASEGYSATYKEENLVYYKISKLPFVKTICETGFNAGHSTVMWLESHPDAKVYSFDLGSHEYGRPIASYLMTQYPGRLNVTWGDSTKTLTEFRAKYPDVKCDLLSIDGGHNNKVCSSDYENFKGMANVKNVVILDNYPDTRYKNELGHVWETGKQKGEILEVFRCSYRPEDPQGFTIGRFIN